MKKAYISIGIKNRKNLNTELNAICQVLIEFGISPLVFVDSYSFSISEEKAMMKTAFREIKQADLLVAETSEKGIGVGIEIGYAKALGKQVIYLRQASSEHSTTASGASDFQIIYRDTEDLLIQLKHTLNQIITTIY